MNSLTRFSYLLLPFLFFLISLITLDDYGMNWDSPIHFARGQAFLRYMLTGKTNYEGLPRHCMNQYGLVSSVDYETGEICDRHRKVRVSEYESSLLDFNSWVAQSAYGHPAFNGIVMAASNNIFFKQLGWVEDINAYHLFSIATTFLLALTVSIWTKQTFGTFTAIIAVFTIYTFPLLFGEQHFNVKDPPMAAFFTLSLYLFWLSMVKKKPLYLIFSALAGGASLGTKFNFVFAPFILLPWIIAYGISLLKVSVPHRTPSKKMILALIFYPVIVFLVFFLTWPTLWLDPLKNVSQVFRYYQDIGGSHCAYPFPSPSWFINCSQLTTLKYFIYTIPPFSLFLFLVGFIVSIIRFKEKGFVTVLWVSFFLVTIMRVTLSVSNIYGGLRQIMEFVAPMAMIAGIGATFLRNLVVKTVVKISHQKVLTKIAVVIASAVLILGYIPIIVTLIKLHPNENVYFNFLIGGLKGAAEKNFPGYGNTYGNVYLQGVKWLNKNAELNTRLALVSGLAQNLSRSQLRHDLDFANNYRSGYNQEGEYLMLLTDNTITETFRYKYLSFLTPLYDLKVDGVSLLKIWRNSKNYLKAGMDFGSERQKKTSIEFTKEENKEGIILKFDAPKNLKALSVTLTREECRTTLIGAKIFISTDGRQYIQQPEGINNFSDREMAGYNADFVYLFPGDEAQYIKFIPPDNYMCSLSDINFSVFTFLQLQSENN